MDRNLGAIPFVNYEYAISRRIADGLVSGQKLVQIVTVEGTQSREKRNIIASCIAIAKIQPRPIGKLKEK